MPLAVVTLDTSTTTASRSGGTARCVVTDISDWQERSSSSGRPNLAYWFLVAAWQKLHDAIALLRQRRQPGPLTR